MSDTSTPADLTTVSVLRLVEGPGEDSFTVLCTAHHERSTTNTLIPTELRS
jgi:hypothetical protein